MFYLLHIVQLGVTKQYVITLLAITNEVMSIDIILFLFEAFFWNTLNSQPQKYFQIFADGAKVGWGVEDLVFLTVKYAITLKFFKNFNLHS